MPADERFLLTETIMRKTHESAGIKGGGEVTASANIADSIDEVKVRNSVACVTGAWKLWAKERTGAREGDTRPFFLVPTTSKLLLRRQGTAR